MKIFLDTASREKIKKLIPTGLIDGITTNPTHLSNEDGSIREVLNDICSMVSGPVSIEVIEKSPEAVLTQAREISKFAKNVVVKIPFAADYLPIIRKLVAEGIKLNITLIFTPLQALMVAKLNVAMISPFLGRWDDVGVDGLTFLQEITAMKALYNFSSQILAASIRTPIEWQRVVQTGADIITLPPVVLEQSMKHPLTDKGIDLFDNDWKKLGKKSLFD
jgi:transaldolase